MREDAPDSKDQNKLRKKKYFLPVASGNNAKRKGVGEAFKKQIEITVELYISLKQTRLQLLSY